MEERNSSLAEKEKIMKICNDCGIEYDPRDLKHEDCGKCPDCMERMLYGGSFQMEQCMYREGQVRGF